MGLIWKKMYESELNRLDSGTWHSGDLFCTTQNLVDRYSVSYVTARRVLVELAKTGRIRNVPSVGSVIVESSQMMKAYFLSPEQLPQGRSPLMLPEIMRGIFEASLQNHIQLISITESELADFSPSEKVGLVYIFGLNMKEPNVWLDFLPENIIPFGVHCPNIPSRGFGVGADHQAAMSMMVQNMIDLGCRKIAYVGASSGKWFFPRYSGFCRHMRQSGLEFNVNHIYSSQEDEYHQKFLRWYDDFQPDAICTPGISIAEMVLRMLKEGERKICQIGSIGIPQNGKQEFSYVKPDYYEEGREIIRKLAEFKNQKNDLEQNSFSMVQGELFRKDSSEEKKQIG